MKKRLNLFCILIFVVLACDVMLMSRVFIAGISGGMRHAEERRVCAEAGIYQHRALGLLPTDLTLANAQTLTDKATGRHMAAWPTQLIVPETGAGGVAVSAFKLSFSLVFGALSGAALMSFILFVRNVNKNRIFMPLNIRLLHIVGWCLVAAGVIATAYGCYDTYVAGQAFSLEGYTVDYGQATSISGIIFGLFSLVMAEAFAVGLRMKEEQELTI